MTASIPLGTDAYTAFRLTMDHEHRAPVSHLLATWNMLGQHEAKRTVEDLPADMTRIGATVVCDRKLDYLVLSFDQAVAEALRLSAEHRAPDAHGWHRMSNIARVMNGLTGHRDLRLIGASRSNVADALRAHPLLEVRHDGADILLRPCDPVLPLVPVTVRVTCPGDDAPRELPDATTFGAAFRSVLSRNGDLVADGTVVTFERDGVQRQATWSQERRRWITPDGRPLLRSDPSDPVSHGYRNGHMVGTAVGFVSTSRTGKVFANVGIPIDSPGDEDAMVSVQDRAEVADVAEAVRLLGERDDLDHVLPGVQPYDGQMGFWLTTMTGNQSRLTHH